MAHATPAARKSQTMAEQLVGADADIGSRLPKARSILRECQDMLEGNEPRAISEGAGIDGQASPPAMPEPEDKVAQSLNPVPQPMSPPPGSWQGCAGSVEQESHRQQPAEPVAAAAAALANVAPAAAAPAAATLPAAAPSAAAPLSSWTANTLDGETIDPPDSQLGSKGLPAWEQSGGQSPTSAQPRHACERSREPPLSSTVAADDFGCPARAKRAKHGEAHGNSLASLAAPSTSGLTVASTGLCDRGLQGRWLTLIKETERQCYLRYRPRALSQSCTAAFVSRIRERTAWVSPSRMPRLTAWLVKESSCTCSYGYGQFVIQPQPFPEWMRELMQQVMPILGISDESQWPDSCNLNWYRGSRDSVAWHADSEDLFQGKRQAIRIISLSLGEGRAFQVRENRRDSLVVTQILNDGDLCLMDGTFQQHYKHQVPKTNGPAKARFNLTWRWIRQHKEGCPCCRPAVA